MQDRDALGTRGLPGRGESGAGLAALFSVLCSTLRVVASSGDDVLWTQRYGRPGVGGLWHGSCLKAPGLSLPSFLLREELCFVSCDGARWLHLSLS